MLENILKKLQISVLFYLLVSCSSNENIAPKLFELVPTAQTNIRISTLDKMGSLSINEKKEFGSSIAVGDLNNDGLMDVAISGFYSGFQLYLNLGDFKFMDITSKVAYGQEKIKFPYGVNIVDVNQDGLNDVYLCINYAQVNQNIVDDTIGNNLLFINQGDTTFVESAAQYMLNTVGYSYHSNFFNRDTTRHMFMMQWPYFDSNPFAMSYLDQIAIDPLTSRILEYKTAAYHEMSDEQTITKRPYTNNSNFIADLNNDGMPDLYLDNDFIMADELFMSTKEGQLQNRTKQKLSNISMFSMGTDVADINNDGFLDFIVVDMLSRDHYRRKSNTLFFSINFINQINATQVPQYQRNSLQLNREGAYFSEVGCAFDIFSTDWSWNPVFADFNLDGYKDLFVTNGTRKDLTNMDYVANYYGEASQYDPLKQWQGNWDKLPEVKLSNYIFLNEEGKNFNNVTQEWGFDLAINSEAAAYADFDLDGDLDLIVFNVDQNPSVYKNNADRMLTNNYLRVEPGSKQDGSYMLGTRVYIFYESRMQMVEITNARGYLSVSEPVAHFGLGSADFVDSIVVVWPDARKSKLGHTLANRIVSIDAENAEIVTARPFYTLKKETIQLEELDVSPPFIHWESNFDDFKYERLIPWRISREGPAIAVGDINSDGLEDFVVGGAADQESAVYIQMAHGRFRLQEQEAMRLCGPKETTELLLFDADNDGDLDMYMGNGSNEQLNTAGISSDELLLNDGTGIFSISSESLPHKDIPVGGACVLDVNSDGYMDLFIAQRNVVGQYGVHPKNHQLLLNDGDGHFSDAACIACADLGMISNVIATDFDMDGDSDIIAVGEFQPIILLENQDGVLVRNQNNRRLGLETGLWRSISQADINHDGLPDYILGNLGTNSIFRANREQPLELFVNDFDNNGTIDPVLFHYLENQSGPFADKDLFCSQMPKFNNKFNKFSTYAAAGIDEIFTSEQLSTATYSNAVNLKSSILTNYIDSFTMKELPFSSQLSPVNDIVTIDLNSDGLDDLITVGNSNSFHYSQGDLLANSMSAYLNNGKGDFTEVHLEGVDLSFQVLNNIQAISIGRKGEQAMIVGVNGGKLRILKDVK